MNYWIISPNIKEHGLSVDEWGELVQRKRKVYIGYDNDHDLGKRFADDVKKGDLVIVAAKSNANKEVYFAGIVADSNRDKEDIGGTVFSKPLISCVNQEALRSMKLDFTMNCSNGVARQVKTITQLHPESKSGDKKIIDTIMEYIKSSNSIKSYCNLLEVSKNLILTGAPGTGKTFLAKEIAANLIGINKNFKPVDKLKELVKNFSPDFEARKENEISRQSFLKQYPLEKLGQLTPEQYCTGAGNKHSFCNWVENGLNKFGKFWPGPRGAGVYGIYYSNDAGEYLSRFDDSPEATVSNIVSALKDAIQDHSKIQLANNYVNQDFLLKLICLYKPESFVPIYSTEHIKYILNLFEYVDPTKQLKNQKLFELSEMLTDFYHQICGGYDITTIEFMELLYRNFSVKDRDFEASWDADIEMIDSSRNIDFVQFHPSYDYTDFVEGLRPCAPDNNGNVGFILTNGVFKHFCEQAKKDRSGQKYVFIIDEINRGEISKIFGELFFSIDPGYRGSKGNVKTQYYNLHSDEEYFHVPDNVYIIGTMNDIDRSVESMDFAMRRRFTWIEIKANENTAMLSKLGAWENEARERLIALNNAIWNNDDSNENRGIAGFSSSYHIGASYFLKLKNYEGDFQKLWDYHLNGLLLEYLRGMPNVADKLKILKEAYDSPGKQI